MGGEIKLGNRNDLDLVDPAGRGFRTSVADFLSGLSLRKRIDRRKQKIRARLVRDYIEDEDRSSSILRAFVAKLTGSP